MRKTITMDYRTLAARFRTEKNRIRRVMHTYGIAAQSLRKKYVYRGLATEIVPNKLREEAFEWVGNEMVFSDILEVKRADGTRVRGCFFALSASLSWLELHVAPIIRWGSFCERLRLGSTLSSRATSTRGSIPSLRFTLRSLISWRIFLHSPSGDVYVSRDWTFLK